MKMADGKFNVKNFKEMMELREGFAKNRFKEKITVLDHGFGNSSKLAGTKHGFRKEVMVIQDGLNEKQHLRKMEQINTIAKSRST